MINNGVWLFNSAANELHAVPSDGYSLSHTKNEVEGEISLANIVLSSRIYQTIGVYKSTIIAECMAQVNQQARLSRAQ